ncbi:hypothetical protein UA08_05695 [Talaromyces atroroseus]|uniref:Nucleoporin NDC1 n=1 Tax=Talaromyces atroroseus TaxID=1441469 RepID=A0A225AT47_TALAT|nr:hypothetical protein UA08_05695 [Talaromyces atroroseus]OKL58769.1 hypothetical protein UA08_05695 [Talaromyces atroroseus]
MAAPPPRPYRRILTSALHRRFVHASAMTLLMDYIVAFVIGTKTSLFWSWFPLGACGIRALLLFISTLAVFFIRVAQMHTGPRTTASPISALRYTFPLHALQTLGWYLFSAWWFSEIYLWSAPAEADLGWVKTGGLNSRTTLNERSIYLHTYHMMLAISQAAIHLYCDYDHLPIPVVKRSPESKDQSTHPVQPVMKRIRGSVIGIMIDALRKGLVVTLASPFIYVLFLRRSAWSFSLYFAKLFWNFSRTAADPPGTVPPAFYTLFIRQIISGGCLVFLWQMANLFFTVFIAQGPIKRGQPLTIDSKDPNGSLINGLKAKKDIVKSYAFWELCFISQRFADRRKVIFNDIERDGGPAWKQMLEVSVENINGITSRINHYKNPVLPTAAKDPSITYPQIQSLPQLTEAPKQDNIFAPSPKANGFGQSFGATAKSFGQSPDWTPVARARAKDAFSQASNAIFSPERKKRLLGGTDEVKMLTGPQATSKSSFNLSSIPFVAQFLRSPIGTPFRQTYAQRLRGIVFGEPHGQVACIVDAIESVTRLLIASLEEDRLGQVQTDVPGVVRLFTETILTLEDFVQNGLGIHWSDVTFPSPNNSDPDAQKRAKYVPEVDIVLTLLRTSLSDLLASFERYSRGIRLQAKDIRLAKAAAGLLDKGDDDHDDRDDPFTSKH